MPRKALILSSENPYHVCARSNNRDWFNLPLNQVWNIFCECLEKTAERYGCEYYAFVLMANHFHLLIGTPRANLGETMRYLMTESSRRIARGSDRINKIFGARYRWSILYTAQDYAYVYKYVFRNPVRAGITQRVQDYPFSTIHETSLGLNMMPMCDRIDSIGRLVPKPRQLRLDWLNRGTSKKAEDQIGAGLRRYEFKFTTDNSHQKSLRLLRSEYGVEVPDTFQA